jgi:hypothetical protein
LNGERSERLWADDPNVTVKVAVPVTMLPSGFVAMAVMMAAPAVVPAVASPVVALMVATEGLLELHTAARIVFPSTIAL